MSFNSCAVFRLGVCGGFWEFLGGAPVGLAASGGIAEAGEPFAAHFTTLESTSVLVFCGEMHGFAWFADVSEDMLKERGGLGSPYGVF